MDASLQQAVDKAIAEVRQSEKPIFRWPIRTDYTPDDCAQIAKQIGEQLPGVVGCFFGWKAIGDASLQAFLAVAREWKQFRVLDLSGTQISDAGLSAIAEAARGWKQFQSLDLSGTKVSLPKEVIDSHDPATIFRYLDERKGSGARTLDEVKVLLVGQGEVGKSNLRMRLFASEELGGEPDEHFVSPPRDPTHDAEVCESSVELDETAAKRKITLRTWDFGGQNYLHATHRFFFHAQRCLYVLVLNATLPGNGSLGNTNRLSYWLRMIAHYGKLARAGGDLRAPVLLVRTQCDRVALAREGRLPDSDTILSNAHDLDNAIAAARGQDWYGANVVGEVVDLGWYDADVQPFFGQPIRGQGYRSVVEV